MRGEEKKKSLSTRKIYTFLRQIQKEKTPSFRSGDRFPFCAPSLTNTPILPVVLAFDEEYAGVTLRNFYSFLVCKHSCFSPQKSSKKHSLWLEPDVLGTELTVPLWKQEETCPCRAQPAICHSAFRQSKRTMVSESTSQQSPTAFPQLKDCQHVGWNYLLTYQHWPTPPCIFSHVDSPFRTFVLPAFSPQQGCSALLP